MDLRVKLVVNDGIALTVKTRMGTRQSVLIPIVSMNVEFAEAIHALKLFEAIEGNFTSTRNELEEFGPFFLVKRSYRAPEPLDLW